MRLPVFFAQTVAVQPAEPQSQTRASGARAMQKPAVPHSSCHICVFTVTIQPAELLPLSGCGYGRTFSLRIH